MIRNKLVWKRNKIEGSWELKVNDKMTKIGDFYDHIADAKAKGLKVALAIIEY